MNSEKSLLRPNSCKGTIGLKGVILVWPLWGYFLSGQTFGTSFWSLPRQAWLSLYEEVTLAFVQFLLLTMHEVAKVTGKAIVTGTIFEHVNTRSTTEFLGWGN